MSSPTPLTNAEGLPGGRGFTMRAAWWAYVILLILPLALLAGVIKSRSNGGLHQGTTQTVDRWFVMMMAYLAVGIPAALFYRRHLCIAYALGKVVTPQKYFLGMLTVWLALEVGMIIPILRCDVTASYLPGLLPAVLAFMFYLTLWPTGTMMIRRVGAVADSAVYRQSR